MSAGIVKNFDTRSESTNKKSPEAGTLTSCAAVSISGMYAFCTEVACLHTHITYVFRRGVITFPDNPKGWMGPFESKRPSSELEGGAKALRPR
jgi:hypothetical protein